MSVITPPPLPALRFYRSGPQPCPYLKGRVERKLFARLDDGSGLLHNDVLTRAGFRRSHDIIYRPACAGCRACVAVRIPATDYEWSRAERRVLRRNADLRLMLAEPDIGGERLAEHYGLFRQYQQARHADSDMARMSLYDFRAMLAESHAETWLVEARHRDGRLAGAMLFDRLTNGLSAVYSYFDPGLPRRALGRFLVLELVRQARLVGLAHVYLGYWVRNCEKMSYKSVFRPLEMLGPEGWQPFTEAPDGR